jgi:hypothetical protein
MLTVSHAIMAIETEMVAIFAINLGRLLVETFVVHDLLYLNCGRSHIYESYEDRVRINCENLQSCSPNNIPETCGRFRVSI